MGKDKTKAQSGVKKKSGREINGKTTKQYFGWRGWGDMVTARGKKIFSRIELGVGISLEGG